VEVVARKVEARQTPVDACICILAALHRSEVAQMTTVRLATTNDVAKTLQQDLLREAGIRTKA